MGKDLNEGKFRKKYLIVDKFSKVIYINDQRKLLESDTYIGPEGVVKLRFNPFIWLQIIKVHLIYGQR